MTPAVAVLDADGCLICRTCATELHVIAQGTERGPLGCALTHDDAQAARDEGRRLRCDTCGRRI